MKPLPALSDDVTPPHAGLLEALHRFGTSAADLVEERRNLPHAPEQRLETLLREIDETVLARQIKLRTDDTLFAALIVSNRRLVSVQEIDANGKKAGNKELSPENCAMWLTSVSGKVTAFETEAASSDNASASSDGTCTVATLRRILQDGAAPSAFDELTHAVNATATARVDWAMACQEAEFQGDVHWRDFLTSRSAAFREYRTRLLSANPETTAPAGFALPLSEKLVLILACDGKNGLAAVLPFAAGVQALIDWQILTAPTVS